MHHKKKLINDQGMSLVELIIVIAIIAVMSGIGFATVTMINSAKAKEAGVTFDSEVSDMLTKAKTQICVVGGTEMPKYRYCMMVYQHSDGKYYLRKGYYNPAGTTDAEKYLFDDYDNTNGQKGVSLSNRIDIVYTDLSGNESKIDNSGDATSKENVTIIFNTDGTIKSGSGFYSIRKRNGNEVTSLTLRKNGNHEID